MCIKTLFTLHRNMKTKPDPNLASMRHIGTGVDQFLSDQKHAEWFDAVCESKKFQFTRHEGL